jgi:hypothetical protein
VKRVVLLVVLAAGMFWAVPAQASAWCGTPGTVDRLPEGNPGAQVHVIYAVASDGTDNLAASIGTLMQTDAETIDTWWRGQDPTRTPRFDTLGFGCGQQLDISLVRLGSTTAELQPLRDRFGRILAGLGSAGFTSTAAKYLVYYDGPNDGSNVCGEGSGSADGAGVAVVFTTACSGVPTSVIAAHELLHAMGALPSPGPPHACPGDAGHPCDSPLDILYPSADGTPLSGLILDVGHDDYYGHSGSWFDLQDSRWLRHLDTPPTHLSVVIVGAGTVTSDVPGISCTASCESDWDGNQSVTLAAQPAAGMRFVRWSGGCTGAFTCTLGLASATTVTALFAPQTFALSIAVAGRGAVRVSSSSTPCTPRCKLAVISFQPVSLRAFAVPGWRFVRWSGACKGTRVACTLPMTGPQAARALFRRR